MDALRVAALLVTLALSPAHPHAASHGPVAYRGAGAWVDRYDFAQLGDAEFAVARMADHGIRTLYLETGSWKVPAGTDVVAPEQTDELIEAAHAYGLKVVAWYLPGFKDLDTDMRRVRAALGFRTRNGQRFDSFALDIEATLVRPLAERNRAMLKLSRLVRAEAGPHYRLGAIVPDQLSTSSGPVLWPRFPYRAAARYYDVFLPMAYSTFGRARGVRAVYRYTRNNAAFAARATGRPVHVIGGITDSMSTAEQIAAAHGARDGGAVGVSLYKFPLYSDGSWAALDAFRR